MKTSKTRHYARVVLIRGLVIAAAAGCGGGLPSELVQKDATGLLARLELNHKAIVLSIHAPYDTVRLDAVARNVYGEAVAHTGTLTFRRANLLDNTVSVDSAGLVRARSATNGTSVIVSLVLDGVERVDTARIMVRTESPVQRIARIEFFPRAPDSAWRWAGSTTANPVMTNWTRLYNAANQVVPNTRAILAYSSDNPDVHFVSAGAGSYVLNFPAARTLGATWLRVKLYAYDTAFVDSVLFRRIEPTIKFVVIDRVVPVDGPPSIVFHPSRLEIHEGTTVVFMNRPGTSDVPNTPSQEFWGNRIIRTTSFGDYAHEWVDSTGITFDAPPGPVLAGTSYQNVGLHQDYRGSFPADGGAGNIASFSWVMCRRINAANAAVCGGSPAVTSIVDPGYRSRRFNTAGTYRYVSTAFPDVSGTIVVTPAP